jgi:hypothetical protein
MTNDEWIAALGALPPQHRVLAGLLMERLNTIITAHANRQHDDIQRLERRLADVRFRLDALEQDIAARRHPPD